MDGSTARVLPPSSEEIEIARKYLREELAKSESQPIEEMRGIDEVFKEMDERFNAHFQSRNI